MNKNNLNDAVAAFLAKKNITVLPTLTLDEQKERVTALNAKTYESCKLAKPYESCLSEQGYVRNGILFNGFDEPVENYNGH